MKMTKPASVIVPNVTETEEYVEVSVTYEVIENIGMQEKIEEIREKAEV